MEPSGILRPKVYCQEMIFRAARATAFAFVLFAFPGANKSFCTHYQQPDAVPDFWQLLQKLADYSPDPCGPSHGREEDWHSGNAETRLFDQAQQDITQELNAAGEGPWTPRERAEEALKKLKKMSGEVNAAWPEENRFHFQILELPPVLVVKMGIRTHETFFVFGIPAEDYRKANRLWRDIGSGDASDERGVPQLSLDIYPLHRGPSGKVRFLARFGLSGCAGPTGVEYDAREWNGESTGGLERIIKQAGSFGLDDKVPGFPQIGKFDTKGPLVTLPYCWYSSIDTWDDPSLCAVDTYDLSGDNVKFHSRVYNRPDLLPIAKAIEYAEKRDYHAVLGYCSSSEVARRLVRDITPDVFFAEDIRVIRMGKDKEHVNLGYGSFDVEKRVGRWMVVGFNLE